MSETLDQITEKLKQISDTYAEKCNINRDDDWYILKLTEELGELSQAYLMGSGRARLKDKTPNEIKQMIEDEAADVLGMLLLFTHHNNIDLHSALERKWYRYLPKKQND